MEQIPKVVYKCCYSTCENYYPDKQIHFVQFPETCLQFQQDCLNESIDLHIKHCKECEKASQWVEACGKVLVKSIHDVTKNLYICGKHFMGGKGPTEENPYPIPVTGGSAEFQTEYFILETKIETEEHPLEEIKEEKLDCYVINQEENIESTEYHEPQKREQNKSKPHVELKEYDRPQCSKQNTNNPHVPRGESITQIITSKSLSSHISLLRKKFKTLTLAEKLKIKSIGRPTPELKILQQEKSGNKTFMRHFSKNIYDKFKWICGCDTVNALYCFPCVLFHCNERDKIWSVTGYKDLKHLNERAKKHEITAQHLKNCVNLALVGSVNIDTQLSAAYRQNIMNHNEQVSKNRYILKRMINCIKFCGKLDMVLRGHNEKDGSENLGVFRVMIDFSSELDEVLKQHLGDATVFKGTSKIIQNEILDSMLAVCRQEIKDQINESDFLAIQCDETTDISNQSQAVLIVRYLFNNNIYERFWSFLRVTDKTADGLTKVIENELNHLIPNSPSKLIAQTYDGANVMSDLTGGVQAKIKNTYKYAHFVHCYAHQLNLIIQKATSQNSKVKVFFSTLSGISAFFSSYTHKCDLLHEIVSRNLPGVTPRHWNYNIRIVFENREKLIECFQEIEEKCNRADTCREAYVFRIALKDPDFVFWLTLFHEIFPYIDILFKKLELINRDSNDIFKELENLEKLISAIITSTDAIENGIAETSLENKRRKINPENRNSEIAKEVCDTIILQLKERLTYRGHLEAANLVDSQYFLQYSLNFPTITLLSVIEFYPMLQQDRLRTELEVIYSIDHLSKIEGCLNMLSWLSKHDLNETFSETVKLLKIVVTTPMNTAETERCFSTLKKIKTFLRNSINKDRLNALAMIAVNQDLMHNISNFDEKVIEHFISLKNISWLDFVYKQ